MLIQSHTGIVRIFPAIPEEWKEVNFNNLRTEGAFLISAKMKKGEVIEMKIISEKGGEIKVLNPFKNNNFKCSSPFRSDNNNIIIETIPGQIIRINI
jgi:alpha-L-fucosidase 2